MTTQSLATAPETTSQYPLFELTRAVAAARLPEEIYEAALSCLQQSLGVEKASVSLLDERGVMRFRSWRGLSEAYRAAVTGYSPWTLETAGPQPVLVSDVRVEPSLSGLLETIEGEGIRAMAFVPLVIGRRLLGKLMLYYAEPHAFSPHEVLIAETIAAHVAFAVDQQRGREHQDQVDAIFRSTVTGIIEVDPNGRFRVVNDRFCQMVGRPREQLLAKMTCFDLAYPEDEEVARSCLESLTEGTECLTLEKRYVRPDGSVVWVEETISAIREGDRSLRGAVAVVSDVTERKLADEAVRLSEERYRGLVDGLGLAVYTADFEGNIVLYNEAAVELWGRRPEPGDLWCGTWRIFDADGAPLPHDKCPMATAIKEGRSVRGIEIIGERPDGARRRVLPHPTPLRDGEGRLIGAVNVLVDVTDRHEMEQRLRRANAVKDEFLSLVSHELRTPIATILGNGILLSRRADKLAPEDRSQAYADIVSEGQRLQRIIENLLMLTRFEDGPRQELEPLLIPPVLQEAVDAFSRRSPLRPVTLEASPGLPVAAGQATLVALVVDNLLNNADKYSDAGQPVDILACTNQAGQVEIRVRDFGIGLNEQERDQMFKPFYRSENAKGRGKGMGLGLAVCHRVMEAQGGKIWAVSRPEGGTDFVFTLQPWQEEAGAPA